MMPGEVLAYSRHANRYAHPTWHQTGKVCKQVYLCRRAAVLGLGRLVIGSYMAVLGHHR